MEILISTAGFSKHSYLNQKLIVLTVPYYSNIESWNNLVTLTALITWKISEYANN